MSTITANAFRRLYLLYVISWFPRGSYGLKRLHKVSYISERESQAIRPFEYKKYHFGQYSESLDEIKDQLVGMGLVGVAPLDTAKTFTFTFGNQTISYLEGGNRFVLSTPERAYFYREALEAAYPGVTKSIDAAANEYGFLSEAELIKRCYDFPEFKATDKEDLIFPSNLPEYVNVQLDDAAAADIELDMDPRATIALRRLLEVVDSTEFDLTGAGTIDLRAVLS